MFLPLTHPEGVNEALLHVQGRVQDLGDEVLKQSWAGLPGQLGSAVASKLDRRDPKDFCFYFSLPDPSLLL